MRADRARSVVEGAAQREIHPRPHVTAFQFFSRSAATVVSAPKRCHRGWHGTGMDMALVQVRMHIDKARQHDFPAAIHAFALAGSMTGSATMRAICHW